jgi:predicted TIM-barrel fold metal-dependent hydrolase
MDSDGVDIQIAFPNKGLLTFAIGDPSIMYPMASVYNDWLSESFVSQKDRILPMALIPTCDVDLTVAELERIAKKNFFRGVLLPNRPVYGSPQPGPVNYNNPVFDRVWAALQDFDLAITFHVSTGQEPFHARGPGSAIINYSTWSHPSCIEPVAHMCASGILEKFPKLRFATIEAGIGYLGWALEAMDEAHKKHYMWTRPRLSSLPSELFFRHGFAAFQEDPAGLALIDPRLEGTGHYQALENCYLWANDYPHHEGSWPHSGAAIERQMAHLTDTQREKILGGNAIRCFKLDDLVAAHARRR